MIQPTIHIEGMAEAWAKCSPTRRHQLLMVMFGRLIIKDGEITHFVPRADPVSEVVDSFGRAIPDGVIRDVPTEHAWRGKGRYLQEREGREVSQHKTKLGIPR